MFESVKKYLNNKKIILLAFAIGVLFVLFSEVFSEKQNESKITFNQEAYVLSLEKRIEEIVSDIYGAGECNVMINIASGSESVYVKENKKSYDTSDQNNKSESEDSVITVKDRDGSEYALVTKELMPEICGVVVACKGADEVSVKNSVIQAVSTVLGVGTNKVCVITKS